MRTEKVYFCSECFRLCVGDTECPRPHPIPFSEPYRPVVDIAFCLSEPGGDKMQWPITVTMKIAKQRRE